MTSYIWRAYDYFFNSSGESSSSSGIDFSLVEAVLKTKVSSWLTRMNKTSELKILKAIFYPQLFITNEIDLTNSLQTAISENLEFIELDEQIKDKIGHLHVKYVYASPNGTTPEHSICIRIPASTTKVVVSDVLDPILNSIETVLNEEYQQSDLPDLSKVIDSINLIYSSNGSRPNWSLGFNEIHQRYLGPNKDYHLKDNTEKISFDVACCLNDLFVEKELNSSDVLLPILIDFLLKPNSFLYKIEFLDGRIEKLGCDKINAKLLELLEPDENEEDDVNEEEEEDNVDENDEKEVLKGEHPPETKLEEDPNKTDEKI